MKIVVLSYNHPELTERTLRSALEFVPDPQILLVHNGSLPQHQMALQNKFPYVQHLMMFPNKGFPGGANAGLQRALENSEWILFLTNDCQLLKMSEPQGPPALVAPMIWGRKLGQVDSLGGGFEIEKACLFHCKTESEFESASQKYIPGTAFWIHRLVFQALQGFDETLEMFWEDVDFSLRAQKAGFPLRADPGTQVLHSMGKTTRKNARYTTYLFQRNRKRVSLKYAEHPARVWWSLIKSWSALILANFLKGDWG